MTCLGEGANGAHIGANEACNGAVGVAYYKGWQRASVQQRVHSMIKVNGNDGKTYGVQLEENQGAYMVRVTGDQGFSHAMEIGLDDNFWICF